MEELDTLRMHYAKPKSSQRGFTLIELLVVVAIISLLASTIMSSLTAARMRARDVRRLSDSRSLTTALELIYQADGHYPCSSGEISTSPSFLQTLVTRGFLSKIPKDPTNSGAYIYYYSTFKDSPSGPCGQIYMINYDVETRGTPCIEDGMLIPIGDPNAIHCHVFHPTALPCSDPYLNLTEASLGPDCAALVD